MQKIPDQTLTRTMAHLGDVKGLVSRETRLYSCGDKTVKVWNEALKLEHEIGCDSSPTSLCVGEGSELFIGREDKKLSLWQSSLESGVRVLGEQDGAVSAIARLGKLLVSGSDQGSIFLWGEKGVSQTLLGHAARLRALFLAQPTVAVSASSDGTIKVWDLQKAVCQETLRTGPKAVWTLAPYNEHQFFAGGEEENVVRLWDLRRVERCIGTLRLELGTITTLCPMGSHLGVGGSQRQVHVIDLNQLTSVSTVSLDNKYPTCLTTFAGKLAVGCNTRMLELYSLPRATPLPEVPHLPGEWLRTYSHQGKEAGRLFLFKAHEAPVTQLCFHYPYLLTRDRNGSLGCYRLTTETSTVERVCIIPNANGVGFGFLPHSKHIYATSSACLYLWNIDEAGSFVGDYSLPKGDAITAVAAQGSHIVLGTQKGFLYLYNARERQGKCLSSPSWFGLSKKPATVALQLVGNELLCLDTTGVVTVRPLEGTSSTSYTLCPDLNPKNLFFSFLPQQQTLIIAYGGRILRFKREKGVFTPLKETGASSVCFAFKEKWLVGGVATSLDQWDLNQEKQLKAREVCQDFQIATDARSVLSLALCPEHHLMVYGDDQGFVTVSAFDLNEAPEAPSLSIPLIHRGDIQNLIPVGEGGNFSTLFKGLWKGMPVAFKALKPPSSGDQHKQKRDFISEVKIMEALRFHPHLTSLCGYCLDPLALVMPFEEGGTLKKRIDSGKPLTGAERKQLALDLADGLDALHQRNAIHADLKSENVLIGSRGEGKIADFGQAKISGYSTPLYIEQTGDYLWQAPEILEQIMAWYDKGKQNPTVIYTQAADIYSLALIFSHLFTGRFPFEGTSPSEKEIIAGKRPKIDDLPAEMQALIQACLQKDPHRRPSLEALRRSLEALPAEQIPGGPSPLIAQPNASICFRCPAPPPYFKGRAHELQSLKEAFQTSFRVAIQGFGGMGKTSLARKYVHDQHSCYPLICSFSGDTPQTLEQGLLDLAKELKVEGDTTEEKLTNLKRYFERLTTPFLLLFDGVDSEASFETLGKHLPLGKGTLLLTTRRESPALRLGFTSSPLKAWSKQEAADYLLSVTKSQEKDHALTLVEKLGSLPLALEQAAFYIRDNHSIQEYLTLFDTYHLRLFSDTLLAPDPSRTILTTWNISLESIETAHRCSLAAPLLSFACFLGPEPLPFSLFEAWLNIGGNKGDLLELNRTLHLLKDYSLLTRTENRAYVFHPLFQEVLRDRLPPEKKIAYLSQTLQVLIAYVKDKDPDHPTNWPLYQHLSPACEALKQACEAYMSATPFPFANPAPLFHSYSRYLLNQGLHRAMYLIATFSLHLARKLEQEKHPDGPSNVAKSLNNLGNALFVQGKYGKAEKFQRDALEIHCRLYPTREHPDVAKSFSNLGLALSAQGKYGEAEKFQRDALKIRCRLYPTREHPDVAKSLSNLGLALSAQGKDGEAEKLHREALEICCRLYPTREHPDVAASLNNLGNALSSQRKYGEAEKFYREALKICCRLYPTKEHPDVAASLNNLGNALRCQGKYGEAEKSHREALEIRGRLYPTRKHPDVAASLNNLGNALFAQDNYGEAEKSHRAALEIRCCLYPTREHPDVAASLNSLGNVLSDQGKYGEAEKFLREAHQIHCRLYPTKEHPDVTWSLNNLIRLLEKMGKHAEIAELRRSMKKPG